MSTPKPQPGPKITLLPTLAEYQTLKQLATDDGRKLGPFCLHSLMKRVVPALQKKPDAMAGK